MRMLREMDLVIALLCFVLAAFGVQSRLNLIAAGLAFWVLTLLF